ncbi:unnamed protein product [Malus baccata var. baccata]
MNLRKKVSSQIRYVLSNYLISECLFFVIFGVCDLEAYTNKFDGWIVKISFIEFISHQNDRFTNTWSLFILSLILSHYLISECLFFVIFGVCNLEAYTNKFDGWIIEISFIEFVSHQNDRFTNTYSSFILSLCIA